MKKIINLIKRIIIYLKFMNVQKDKNIWVFGALRGKKYMDNAKYFFEYVNNNTHIYAVWLTKDTEVYNILKSKKYRVFMMDSKEGLNIASKAKVAIITHRGNNHTSDLPFYAFNKKTFIVQLWHGIPLKKIGFDDKLFSFKYNENSYKYKLKEYIKTKFFPFLTYHHKNDLVLALSEETRDIFSKAFRTDKKNIAITGYPRNDIILSNHNQKDNFSTKIIYMPTFRDKEDGDFKLLDDYGFDVEEISNYLKKNDQRLFIKLHPFNKMSSITSDKVSKSNFIEILNNDDIYENIQDFDILITDYSSIYFDFLLLNKPIIFAPFDRNKYLRKDREFYFDYDEITPGVKTNNWNEVLNELKNIKNGKDKFVKNRNDIKNRFHKFLDNNSCERVYNEIYQRIE